MKIFNKDLSEDLVVIAEIGVNHEGSVDVAERLVREAGQAGVDAVKLQSYTPWRFVSPSDPVRLARVTRFALDEQAHHRLIAAAREVGVHLISTPVTEDWLPFLATHCPAIKIASGDLTFEPLIRAAARSGRPVILSTGCGSTEEIDRAVSWVAAEIGGAALRDALLLMHCVSAYPTPVDEANLLSIPYLQQRYGLAVGYSNHVIEPETVLASVALGAQAVELHVTDRREGREFRDHALSFEVGELSGVIEKMRRVCKARGRYGKIAQPSEAGNTWIIRKGLIAAQDLAAGACLTEADIAYARPATEFTSADLPRLLGKTLTAAKKRGETILRSDIAASA